MYENIKLAPTYQNSGEDSQGPKLITLPTPTDLTKCPLKRKSAKEYAPCLLKKFLCKS